MAVNIEAYQSIKKELDSKKVVLVAVSKTKPVNEIQVLYDMGQRDFGENYVQELVEKQKQLPHDIRWHFIGHLQRNKVKYIAPFVYLIHGVDSFRLLEEIGKQAGKLQRDIHCLLQVHIATEETKFGMDEKELAECLNAVVAGNNAEKFSRVKIRGLMGMASFSENRQQIKKEFEQLHSLYQKHLAAFHYPELKPVLSMGMSADYEIALQKGSNMIRVGSALFGTR